MSFWLDFSFTQNVNWSYRPFPYTTQSQRNSFVKKNCVLHLPNLFFLQGVDGGATERCLGRTLCFPVSPPGPLLIPLQLSAMLRPFPRYSRPISHCLTCCGAALCSLPHPRAWALAPSRWSPWLWWRSMSPVVAQGRRAERRRRWRTWTARKRQSRRHQVRYRPSGWPPVIFYPTRWPARKRSSQNRRSTEVGSASPTGSCHYRNAHKHFRRPVVHQGWTDDIFTHHCPTRQSPPLTRLHASLEDQLWSLIVCPSQTCR